MLLRFQWSNRCLHRILFSLQRLFLALRHNLCPLHLLLTLLLLLRTILALLPQRMLNCLSPTLILLPATRRHSFLALISAAATATHIPGPVPEFLFDLAVEFADGEGSGGGSGMVLFALGGLVGVGAFLIGGGVAVGCGGCLFWLGGR